MADSKRLHILKKLTDYLESEVSVANGYQHDLAGFVFRGKEFFDSRDPLPMVSILESPNPTSFPPLAGEGQRRAPEQLTDLVLLITGHAVDDALHPTDPAHLLEADVTKALAKLHWRNDPRSRPVVDPELYMLYGLLTNIGFEPSVVRPPTEQVSDAAFFWKRVTLRYAEDPNDPYRL